MLEFAVMATEVVELGKLIAAVGMRKPKIRTRWLQMSCMVSSFIFWLDVVVRCSCWYVGIRLEGGRWKKEDSGRFKINIAKKICNLSKKFSLVRLWWRIKWVERI